MHATLTPHDFMAARCRTGADHRARVEVIPESLVHDRRSEALTAFTVVDVRNVLIARWEYPHIADAEGDLMLACRGSESIWIETNQGADMIYRWLVGPLLQAARVDDHPRRVRAFHRTMS